MSERNSNLLIADILESANKIKQYTTDLSFDSFVKDSKTCDGFRNRIVHDYMGIDYKIVWMIIQNDIDKLMSDVRHILKS